MGSNKLGGGNRIGRDARTGQYIPVKEAERRPSTTIIEKRPSPKK